MNACAHAIATNRITIAQRFGEGSLHFVSEELMAHHVLDGMFSPPIY